MTVVPAVGQETPALTEFVPPLVKRKSATELPESARLPVTATPPDIFTKEFNETAILPVHLRLGLVPISPCPRSRELFADALPSPVTVSGALVKPGLSRLLSICSKLELRPTMMAVPPVAVLATVLPPASVIEEAEAASIAGAAAVELLRVDPISTALLPAVTRTAPCVAVTLAVMRLTLDAKNI